mmetsp:Transcript_10150/g.15396  ORF Transcript_10150/g.15396 Transcript_10150/m.15396 type:complete len:166 (+) Transcript_10150:143-640(+)
MDHTLEGLKKLSQASKRTLMDAIVVYPNTESISSDITRAIEMGVEIEYSNLETDIRRIESISSVNPKFNQLSARDLNLEILRSMLLNPDLNYNSVEYIYFQRINTPTLLLRNTTTSFVSGVSIFVDLNDARVQIHRYLSIPSHTSELISNLEKSIPIALAIVLAG